MKVSIVGTGRVGSACAFALVLRRLADELVLVGRDPDDGEGDAADLMHASAFLQQMLIRAGGIEAVVGSDVVVMTAAVTRGDGVDRLGGTRDNARLFADIIPRIVRIAPGAVFVVVTNPVDVMTYLTLQYSGLPANRVMGTGTLIDTARYRTLLSEYVGVHTNDLRAYILGEHGETQFAAMASASAGGQRLDPADPMFHMLAERARGEGHRVFRAKGFTNYAIAGAVAMLVEAVRFNSRSVFPVSALLQDYHGLSDVCLSVPAVIGRSGIQKLLKVELSPAELDQLRASAEHLRNATASVNA
jgi:L-lactate dehydrogenase